MQKETVDNSKSNPIDIEAMLFGDDSDDSADFLFKPVTDGLGFHNEENEDLFLKKTKRERIIVTHPKKVFDSKPVLTEMSINENDLSSFYGSVASEKQNKSLNLNLTEVGVAVEAESSANLSIKSGIVVKQFSAWLIDLSLLAVVLVACLTFFLFFSGLSIDSFLSIIAQGESLLLGAGLFVLFYFTYFTFIDRGDSDSLGKKLTNLQMISTDGSSVNVFQTFFRSLIVAISIFALCLPLILDFHGKLTDTKIVEKQDGI